VADVDKNSSPAVLKRSRDLILVIQFVITFGLITNVCFSAIRSPDFWWQLLEGQEVLATGNLNGPLPRTFGLPASPFVNEYIVYEAIIALIHKAIGMGGLRVFFGFINVLPFVLVLGVGLRYRSKVEFTDLLAGTAAFGLLYLRLSQRPEILGSALLILLGLTLLRDSTSLFSVAAYAIVGGLLFFGAISTVVS
jgi:hypothetical protein